MDLATFRGLLEQHGPALDRWPSAAAEAAVALMADCVEAQDLFAAATAAEPDRESGDPTPLLARIMSAIRKP